MADTRAEREQYIQSVMSKLSPTDAQMFRDAVGRGSVPYGTLQQLSSMSGVPFEDLRDAAIASVYGDSLDDPEAMARIRQQGGTSESEVFAWNRRMDATRAQAETDAAAQAEQGRVDDLTAQIKAFGDSLGVADPRIAAYLQRRATDIGQASAGRAGVSGRSGLSQLGTAGIAGQLDAQYAFQRQGLQAQVYGLANQRDLGLGQLNLQYDQMRQQQAEQEWAAQQNQAQGVGSAIGAGLAAIPGVALAPYTGGASLGLIGAGAAAGGGIGGLTAQGAARGPSYSSLPQYGTYGRKSGSLGNTGF